MANPCRLAGASAKPFQRLKSKQSQEYSTLDIHAARYSSIPLSLAMR
jgi:hypothetical protein